MSGVIEFLVGWLLLSVVLTAAICRAINKAKVAERLRRETSHQRSQQ